MEHILSSKLVEDVDLCRFGQLLRDFRWITPMFPQSMGKVQNML